MDPLQVCSTLFEETTLQHGMKQQSTKINLFENLLKRAKQQHNTNEVQNFPFYFILFFLEVKIIYENTEEVDHEE